ncbi:hypothetical protein GCM10022221_62390 [Actinocorallia aurea]
MLISDPEQVVLEAEPYSRLSYTWHTITPELAKRFGWDDELLVRLSAEARSKVTFTLEETGPRIGYLPECPDTDRCRVLHATMNGSIGPSRSGRRRSGHHDRATVPMSYQPPMLRLGVVRLCDVDDRGTSRNIVDGIIRVRTEPGRVDEHEIDLWSTSNVFKAGHRLRVHVTSSNFPRWDRNLNTGEPELTATKPRIAQQTIHHDAQHPSHLILPVIR